VTTDQHFIRWHLIPRQRCGKEKICCMCGELVRLHQWCHKSGSTTAHEKCVIGWEIRNQQTKSLSCTKFYSGKRRIKYGGIDT